MTEQTDTTASPEPDLDPFWVKNRAEFLATLSSHADPNACGTCRSNAAAGQRVKHDECQQRATLLPAPDHPYYEILAGFPLEENEKLPARFHIPVFDDCGVPNSWLCAVCQEEGQVVGWPCATATKYGMKVFTPQHEAETAAKRQTARIAELEAQLTEMTHLRDNALRALNRDDVDTDIDLEETIAAPFYGPGWDWDESDLQPVVREAASAVRPAFGKLTQQRDNALARVAELEAELKKYVGAEPTIAEEMAYLSRCFHAVHDLCDQAKRSGSLGITPEAVEQAASGEWTAATPQLALPWAHVMDDYDLHLFLEDLVGAAINRWRTDVDGPVPDRETLAAVEKACAEWRTPGQGRRSDEPGTGEG